jgi:signal transduction histidine kinase
LTMKFNLDFELLETVFEAISNEVQILEAVMDDNGSITDFRYLTGSKAVYAGMENPHGKLMLSLYPWKKETRLFDHFVKVVEDGTPLDTTFEVDDNGHSRWYRIKARKFNSGLVLIREDITKDRQSEEKIMQLNQALFFKNRELEALTSELKTFNSIAANDYNETLKHLYNSMEFIITNDAKNLSDAGKANIRRAQAAIQKMKLLTDDIIAFSKVSSEEPMLPVDLNDILVTVQSSLEEKITAENAMIRADSLPVIMGYSSLIALLFYHLINNAIKFRKNELDPVIDVNYTAKPGNEIEHSAAIPEISYNLISVIDNGIGFDPQEGEKIFTMFYRLHEKGKKGGIGLAICKKIMDLHGGFIASECTPECTTFKCYFPIQRT